MSLYKSKLGDVRTKQEWLKWADDFYNRLGAPNIKPVDYWDRVQRVLKLEEIEVDYEHH